VAAAIYASLCAGFLAGANLTRGWVETLLAIFGGLFFLIGIWCGIVWGFGYFLSGASSTASKSRLAEVRRTRTAISPRFPPDVIARSSAALGAIALFCLVVVPSSSIYFAGLAIVGGVVAMLRARRNGQTERFVSGFYAFGALGLGVVVTGIYLANHHHW